MNYFAKCKTTCNIVKQNTKHMEQNTGIELMPLIHKGDDIMVDGRLLHKALNVGTLFKDWIIGRIRDYNFEEGRDYFRAGHIPASKNTQVSREVKNGLRVEYSLTIDMAKELAMIERNETGRMFRRYFINKEKEARHLALGMGTPVDFFKQVPQTSINGAKLYQYTPLMRLLGYSTGSGCKNRRDLYPNHFMNIGNNIYVSEMYANHLFKSSLIVRSRKAVRAMQPLLSPNFGAPLQIK